MQYLVNRYDRSFDWVHYEGVADQVYRYDKDHKVSYAPDTREGIEVSRLSSLLLRDDRH